MKKIVLFFIVVITLLLSVRSVLAGECKFDPNCDENTCRIMAEDCANQIKMLQSAIKPNEDKMIALEKDINALEANLKALGAQLEKKKTAISVSEQKFVTQQKYLDSQVRDYYKKNWTSPLEYFLTTIMSGDNASDTLHLIAYRQNLINRDKATITGLVLQLVDLNKQKKDLEANQNWLSEKQASLEVTLSPIKKLVAQAKAYQSQLNQTVGALNARQQQLIAAKIGSLNLSRSAGISMACSDDRNIDPEFSPRFAFYTFGIPHRVGLNQFGARGRALAGETNPENILRAYFQNVDFNSGFDGQNVRVNGTNEYGQTFSNEDMNIETYLNHLYEMPADWPAPALQAQAIAARSYALAVMKDSGYVRPSQADQVIKKEENSQAWRDAVTATRGKVMTQGGQPIKAWFSSTDGGYTLTSGEAWTTDRSWTKHTRDTNGDVNSIGDLQAKAYDRDSPCFYNAQGWRKENKNSAWLRPEEVADIANVILLVRKRSEMACFLFSPDKPAPSPDKSCPQTDNWSPDKVRQELGSEALSTATSVEIGGFDFGAGRTTNVKINGISFSGDEFKDYFNLRAPANIAIVGPLFNIEKR